MNDLAFDTWGSGTTVVLVHGSLATGAEEWEAQRSLAGEGFRLVVPDRRGYGRSPAAAGEDFVRDGEDIADLLGDGAHLVGHSYGGVGALLAAARRPGVTRSLAVLEPAALALAQDEPAARALAGAVRSVHDDDTLPDDEWLARFLEAVGTDPSTLTPDILAGLVPLVPLVRRARGTWDADLPLAELAAADFPKLVVSGGHSAGFDAICDDLADRIGGSRAVIPGAAHEIQLTGRVVNDELLSHFRAA